MFPIIVVRNRLKVLNNNKSLKCRQFWTASYNASTEHPARILGLTTVKPDVTMLRLMHTKFSTVEVRILVQIATVTFDHPTFDIQRCMKFFLRRFLSNV